MIAAGVGCRRDCPTDDVIRAVLEALAAVQRERGELSALFAPDFKAHEAALPAAAAALGIPLVLLPKQELAAETGAVHTRSARVQALFALPSVAETAALAGARSLARPGQVVQLLSARHVAGAATCALASVEIAT